MVMIWNKHHSDLRSLRRTALLVTAAWTFLCLLSGFVYVGMEKGRTMDLARKEATTIFNKDKAFRLWATGHGGVYAPVSEETQPNPALSHIPERDIVTEQGRRLTLLNPAYMMRQIMDQYEKLYDVKGHITSLNLTNECNAPDEWERRALVKFEKGMPEVFDVEEDDGRSWLRLMRPMIATESCLKCHADQGYKVGDVRGAIGVSLSLDPYRKLEAKAMRVIYTSHLLFWLLGLLVIALFFDRGKRRIAERLLFEESLAESFEKIKLFAYSVSHDLKSPVVAIHGLTKLLEKRYGELIDEKGRRYCREITRSAEQITKLVEQINIYISTTEHPIDVEELDLKDILAQVRQEHSQALSKRAVSWHEPEELPLMTADRLALLRVFRNFVDNALKYGGDDLANIKIGYEEDASFHILSVHDDGVALSDDACQKVFELFSREAHSQHVSGSGLGLAIVKEIAELHGGKVWSSSAGDEGVTFYFAIAKKL